jgi:ribose-phosphate pyrophosphokinase
MLLDLTQGLTDNSQYKAWKFAGGEIHFKLKTPLIPIENPDINIQIRVNSSDDLMLLIIAIDTVKKANENAHITVFMPYMPYQQADRDFSTEECFSLKTVTNLLNTLPVNKYIIFDAHSDVSPALLKNCRVISNELYIAHIIRNVILKENMYDESKLVILSPDAGAYKKIFKLASNILFKGEVASANKSRSISTGNIDSVELSKQDFEGKDILIIDDICIGGRTFVELAKKLKERNVGKLYLAVSHGIFSNGFSELSKYFEKAFTTDSRSNSYPISSGLVSLGTVPEDFVYVHKILQYYKDEQ